MSLAKLIAPARVPSKTRLVATLKELTRLVQDLPEPMCIAIEKSGVIATWRAQLETLTRVSSSLGNVGEGVRAATMLVNAVRKATGR